MTPYDSDDLTVVVKEQDGKFIVYWSPKTAERQPDYERIGTFPTLQQAETYLKLRSTQ